MMQQKKPDDYVIATGKQTSVKNFINMVAKKLKLNFLGMEKELMKLPKILTKML